MNKFLTLFVLGLSVFMANSSLAGDKKGGFEGPGIKTSSVKEALEMKDDAPVVLKGKIEKSLGNEKYQFNDGTGVIIIEIDDDEWNGITVSPDMLIQISGEIDKGLMSTPEVDVEMIMLAQ